MLKGLEFVGLAVAATSLDLWATHILDWGGADPAFLKLFDGTKVWRVSDRTVVWWRRPGVYWNPVLGEAELTLASDECAIYLPGALEAAGVRWLDDPWTMERARNRLLQLRVARDCGIPAPETTVTNDAQSARRFLQDGTAVAKTISTGPGLAPFVSTVPNEAVDLIANAPTLLQREVRSEADVRLVLVDLDCFGWIRGRSPSGPVDWRQADPDGGGFTPIEVEPGLKQMAHAMQTGLRLRSSVQDWLMSAEGPIFLEVNPQGQWAFLQSALDRIPRAITKQIISAAE